MASIVKEHENREKARAALQEAIRELRKAERQRKLESRKVRKPQKNNALLLHPMTDSAGVVYGQHAELCHMEPKEGQPEFYMRIKWWHMTESPIYLWCVNGNGAVPFNHSPSGQTPSDLYDNNDWSPAARYLRHRSKLADYIKVGIYGLVAVGMAFILFLILDMFAKGNV